ncbi:stage III sporulation protein AF [Lederbergia galactosidilyticus]|uniref:stage III sporulation protein AF n=1 Tax=Lederbergia galactosidilytica TaxID=217031 RepID=UPI001AE66AC3|nr:stage III sporulation protein AF [Lederbergia galactosidilytica]MBP1914744.1 stage III sporulation protein AF [Lederbergia galactosidilytica]
MEFIKEWILNIIIFLLLSMIVDMLLPANNMRKYVKLVTGLLLISIIITPLFQLLSSDYEQVLGNLTKKIEVSEQSTGNLLEKKKIEIQASQHAYTLEQMAVQMKKEVEKELMDHYQVVIKHIKISADADMDQPEEQINHVVVHVAPSKNEIEIVEPIVINTNEEKPKENSHPNSEILTLLSNRWEIPAEVIEIVSGEEPAKDGES